MSPDNPLKKLESLIAQLMHQMKIPGLGISVVKDGKILYSRAFGARRLEGNLPATTDTLYGIGSITKSFTCIGIMQLQEAGKLSIEDPITKYLPIEIGLKEKSIKIKHLMSHNSGIPDLGSASILISRHSHSDKETYIPFSNESDLYLHINNASQEVFTEPEKKFFYFNMGYMLLGLIIEEVSGMNYADYISENILKPLNMNRSTFSQTAFESDADHMTAYTTGNDGNLKESVHPFDKLLHAAGGLLSSVNDMTNYLQFFLNEGEYNSHQIISKDSLEELFAPRIKMPQPSDFGLQKYGYGLAIIDNFFGEILITHGGSTGVSSAYLAFIPSKGLGVFIAGNVGNTAGSKISEAILASFLGKDPIKDIPGVALDQKLNMLVGDYQTYKGINKYQVVKNGSNLALKDPEKDCPSNVIIPNNDKPDDYTFWTPLGLKKFPIEFRVDKENNKIDLVIERTVFHKKG
jgi:CubicO group peptidase (beta-lactamase class C family)